MYSEWGSDPKVQSMSEAMQRRHAMLMCLRNTADLTELTDREIAHYLNISPKELHRTHAVFVEKGFITEGWDLPNWEARQEPSDPKAAERMREYRKRQAALRASVRHNAMPNGTPTAPRAQERESPREQSVGGKDAARPPVTPNEPTGTDPPSPHDPHHAAVEALVHEYGLDATWRAWLNRVLRSAPGEWVRDVVSKCQTRGRWDLDYAAAILERYRQQGGTDRDYGRQHRSGPVPLVKAPPEPEPPELPAGPEGDVFRAMWGDGSKGRADA